MISYSFSKQTDVLQSRGIKTIQPQGHRLSFLHGFLEQIVLDIKEESKLNNKLFWNTELYEFNFLTNT